MKSSTEGRGLKIFWNSLKKFVNPTNFVPLVLLSLLKTFNKEYSCKDKSVILNSFLLTGKKYIKNILNLYPAQKLLKNQHYLFESAKLDKNYRERLWCSAVSMLYFLKS